MMSNFILHVKEPQRHENKSSNIVKHQAKFPNVYRGFIVECKARCSIFIFSHDN
jgi:hypothetical protein